MRDYFIVGDTKNYGTCLVCLCGKTEDNAKKILNRMLTNPDDNDKRLMKGHTNLRIESKESNDCWWNDPFLAN